LNGTCARETPFKHERMWNMRLACLLFSLSLIAAAQPYKHGKGWRPLLDGKDLAGWTGQDGKAHDWVTLKNVTYDSAGSPKALGGTPGPSGIILNSLKGKTANIHTNDQFGDAELYLEFMVPQGSNSGVYLQGLYEIQVFDSYGKDKVTTSDGGAIYHRWIDGKPAGGSAPRVNASRKPGEWQSYHVWFQAPKFDSSGKKTSNATFIRVLYNGVVVQENVEAEGGTRSHMNVTEAALNPLMLQGDHGPVAYRNIYIRPLASK
jgi:hypothetical protein